MAIVSITEDMKSGARSASWSLDSGRQYQRKWLVETDSPNHGPNMVLTAFGYKFGDLYTAGYAASEIDKFAWVNSIDCVQSSDDGLSWEITLGYGHRNPAQEGGPDQNPLLMPIEVSWDMRDHETVLERDINGEPVVNTAGDPFDPPVVIDDPRLLMTVVRNEAKFNLSWVTKYRNAINTDPFGGFDPYFCKVMNISGRSQWHQDAGWYYQVTYQFEFITPKVNDITLGFRKQIVSLGYRAISPTDSKPYHIMYRGVAANSPSFLDQDGYLLKVPEDGDPFFIDTPAYPELEFAAFGFDPDAISGQRSGVNYAAAPPKKG